MKSQNIFERIGWPSTDGISIGCKFPTINIRGQEDIVEMSDEINEELQPTYDPILDRLMDLINGEGWSDRHHPDDYDYDYEDDA